MTKNIYLVILLASSSFLFSCLRTEEVQIEGPEDVLASMTIERNFGENEAQLIKTIFKNENGEISELKDGFVKFNEVILDWDHISKTYHTDASYNLQESTLNTFEIHFPNGDISVNEIQTPKFLSNVEIPTEININENTEITWEGGNPSDEVSIVIWTRPLEMESWEVLVSKNTPDDGSYILLSTTFDPYMGNWQVAVEVVRGINGTPDPLLIDNSIIYSLFVFGSYSGTLVDN